MIRLQQIKSIADKNLEPLITLFEESFPLNERRDTDKVRSLITSSNDMIFNAIIDSESQDSLLGLMIYWKIENFYYLEYFAVFPEMRNKKIGEKALHLLKEISQGKTLILEAEPYSDSNSNDLNLSKRRIEFYQRNGFSIIEKNYFQPAYSLDKEGLPLWILGISNDDDNISTIIESMKKYVYYNNY